MPTKIEKDTLSGQNTTGHEWDGVKELNTPLPTWWVYTFYACIAFAVIYCVLYPSWPWLTGHTQGVLGYSSRAELAVELQAQTKARAKFVDKIRATSPWPAAAPPSRPTACSAMARAAPAALAFPTWSTTTGSGAAASTRSTRPSSTASATPTISRGSR